MDLFDHFLTKLKAKEPFTFSRFGDGEWMAILGFAGKNTDGHEYFPDMGAALGEVLKSRPKYSIGIQNHALRGMGDDITGWLKINGAEGLQIWLNADVWHRASIDGEFERFFEATKNRIVVMIGPPEYRNLHVVTGWVKSFWIQVPSVNCWKSKDHIVQAVENYLHPYEKTDVNVVCLFSASMAANVMIDELYQSYGEQHTFLDLGSVFSPYVGVSNRSYHKKIIERLEEAKKVNR